MDDRSVGQCLINQVVLVADLGQHTLGRVDRNELLDRGGVGRGLGRIEIALEIDLVASAENIGDDALA